MSTIICYSLLPRLMTCVVVAPTPFVVRALKLTPEFLLSGMFKSSFAADLREETLALSLEI